MTNIHQMEDMNAVTYINTTPVDGGTHKQDQHGRNHSSDISPVKLVSIKYSHNLSLFELDSSDDIGNSFLFITLLFTAAFIDTFTCAETCQT